MSKEALKQLKELLSKFLSWQTQYVDLDCELETQSDLYWIKYLRDDVERIYKLKKTGYKKAKKDITW